MNKTGQLIVIFLIAMAVVVGIVALAIYFPQKATVISASNNSLGFTIRDYMDKMEKDPIPEVDNNAKYNEVRDYVIRFRGYLNKEEYKKFHPKDILRISGDTTRNAPGDMSGRIFTDNITCAMDQRFFKQ